MQALRRGRRTTPQPDRILLPTAAAQVEGDLDRSAYDSGKPNELLLRLRRNTEPYYKVGGGGGRVLCCAVLWVC